MALMPKRVKHRKAQRGRVRGNATRGNTVAFGDFGIQSLEPGWITGRQIEAGRMAATHYLHREGRVYIRIFPDKPVYPAVNTRFIGLVEEQGKWLESCLACGDCKLGKFGGVCPIARCSKSLLNGPCGGSADGKCEIDPENVDCGWQLIYDRLEKLGQLENLTELEEPTDYTTAHDGGPRRMDRKDMHL